MNVLGQLENRNKLHHQTQLVHAKLQMVKRL